jgi:predicted small secreted protein
LKIQLKTQTTKLVVLLWATLFLAGCNTIQGVGKDVKKTGETIEKAAR